MKIGVFGNCQSVGMATSISALVNDAEVYRFGLHEARTATDDKIEAAMLTFEGCDFVFFQPSLVHNIKGVSSDDFVARCKTLIAYPLIACRVLQPDCHYLKNNNQTHLEGPLGPYQSGIAAGAFLSGLSVERTAALFNKFTYQKLGYLDLDYQDEAISREARRHDYNFQSFIDGKHGRFMHTINHPSIEIIFETARQGLKKANVTYREPETLPNDWLSENSVWPIYPGLATSIKSSENDFRFRRRRTNTDLSLLEFLEESFSVFRNNNGEFRSDLSDQVRSFISSYVI